MNLEERAIQIGKNTPFEGMYDALKTICRHENKRKCYERRVDGSCWGSIQCCDCGEKVSHLKREKNSFIIPTGSLPFNENLYRYSQRLHSIAWNAFKEKASCESKIRHLKAINSPHWENLKKKVRARCKGLCEGCGDHAAAELHHLTYDHLGAEFLFEVVYLCRECHGRVPFKTNES